MRAFGRGVEAAILAAGAVALAACGGNVHVDTDGTGGAASTGQPSSSGTGGFTSSATMTPVGPVSVSVGPGPVTTVGPGPGPVTTVGPGPTSSVSTVGPGPVGPGPTSSSTGAGCNGLVVSGDATCDACLDASCCSDVLPCLDPTTACGQFEACIQGGTSEAQCDATTHGRAAFDALQACASAQCSLECQMQSAICDSGLTTSLPACDMCLGDEQNGCCQAFEVCAASHRCLDCVSGQATHGCDSRPDVQAVDNCFGVTCAAACGGGAGGGGAGGSSATGANPAGGFGPP